MLTSRALGVYHYGPLPRSDWLPTDECEDEHVRPGEDSQESEEDQISREHREGDKQQSVDDGMRLSD